MRFRIRAITGAAAFGCCAAMSSVFAVSVPACPTLPEMPPLQCAPTAQGWFYAGTPDAAAQLADDALAVATDFERYFGRAAPRGAVIAAGTAQAIPASAAAALEATGIVWQLPWLDAAERRALQRNTVERQLRAQRPDASDAEIRATAEAALPARSDADANAADRSALRHEIGHMLLMRAFWPSRPAAPSASPHYGGPGPDWLDELAAVLMESEAMADSRRTLLHSSAASQHLQPLPAFFTQQHPMAAQLPALQAQAQPGANVRVISGETAQRMSADARWFYAQARGVADFLIERTGDPRVFGSIVASLADGGDMDGWLKTHGPQFGLPSSVADLDADWTLWLAARTASARALAAQDP